MDACKLALRGLQLSEESDVEQMSERRDELMVEATKLIESRGYRSVGIQDITESAGISVGSFYSHFRSKEDLYLTIVRRIESDGIARAERIVARYRSPVNQIRALYRFVTLGVRYNRILRGLLRREREFMSPGIRQHLASSEHIKNRIEAIIRDILHNGTMKNVFRTGLYRNAGFLVTALFDTILQNLDSVFFENVGLSF